MLFNNPTVTPIIEGADVNIPTLTFTPEDTTVLTPGVPSAPGEYIEYDVRINSVSLGPVDEVALDNIFPSVRAATSPTGPASITITGKYLAQFVQTIRYTRPQIYRDYKDRPIPDPNTGSYWIDETLPVDIAPTANSWADVPIPFGEPGYEYHKLWYLFEFTPPKQQTTTVTYTIDVSWEREDDTGTVTTMNEIILFSHGVIYDVETNTANFDRYVKAGQGLPPVPTDPIPEPPEPSLPYTLPFPLGVL